MLIINLTIYRVVKRSLILPSLRHFVYKVLAMNFGLCNSFLNEFVFFLRIVVLYKYRIIFMGLPILLSCVKTLYFAIYLKLLVVQF